MEEDWISEVSSVVFVPSMIPMTHKRARGVLSVAASEKGPKKKKRGRPRAANILDQIVTGRGKKQSQEREEWERKRMKNSNLVIPPATNQPSLEEITEELENQPTPDFTSELMQVVRTTEKVATISRNLNGVYVRALRLADLKVHAGTNLLARRLHEQAGGNTNEALADLRMRNRMLQLERKRLVVKEVEQTDQITRT